MPTTVDPYFYRQSSTSDGWNIKRCSRAPTYIDGSARSQCRGFLHLLIFIIIIAALPLLMSHIFLGSLERRWWKLVFFFLTKASQYFSSMYLHIFPHRDLQDFYSALQVDYMTIPVSGFSNSILIYEYFSEFLLVAAIYLVFILITGFAIHLQYKYPRHASYYRNLRIMLNTVQFLLMLVHNGVYAGLRDLWVVAYTSYIIGFCAFFSTRAPMLPWHKSGIYGSHEDFHFFLFIADFAVMLRGVLFLEKPWIMNDPSTHFFRWGKLFFWDEALSLMIYTIFGCRLSLLKHVSSIKNLGGLVYFFRINPSLQKWEQILYVLHKVFLDPSRTLNCNVLTWDLWKRMVVNLLQRGIPALLFAVNWLNWKVFISTPT